jgi:bZIP-type transcription factor MBZ1
LLAGGEGPVLPPPAPLPEVSAAITAAAPKPSPPLISPNYNKDLPASSRGSNRAFWAGNTTFNNFTPVHTTLVPEYSIFANTPSAETLSGKPDPASGSPLLQENINPALNKLPPNHGQTPMSGVHHFDAFADVNPFTLKTLDAYRMQLWGRMALAQQQQRKQQQQPGSSPTTSVSGLASELRPAFFTTSAKPNVSPAVLAGKAAAANAPAPLPGTLGARQAERDAQAELAAAMASQTLLQRLGGAFWDAFSGTDKRAGVDAEKVRRVLEGTAVVRVVDVDEPAPAPSKSPRPVPTTMPRMPASPKLSPRLAPTQAPRNPACGGISVSDLLEESMRALTISKKSPTV